MSASVIPIRCALVDRSNPPDQPMDASTELIPQGWRGADFVVQLGVFDRAGVSVDMGALVYLECDIFELPIPNDYTDTNYTYGPGTLLPYPSLPPAPIAFVTVEADDIEPTITRAGWTNGTEENVTFSFSAASLSALNLGGRESRRYWMVIHGLTESGTKPVYGAGPVDFYESGAQTVYLQNNLAPITIPNETTLYIPYNQQMPFALPIQVNGILRVDGVLVDVSQP